MTDRAFDPDTMNHLEAIAAIKDLPEDSDFDAIRELEEAREKGPRPSVIRALDSRTGALEDPDEDPDAPEEEVVADDSEDPNALSPAGWRRVKWRGNDLYKCLLCEHQTFELGRAYAHHQKAHS